MDLSDIESGFKETELIGFNSLADIQDLKRGMDDILEMAKNE